MVKSRSRRGAPKLPPFQQLLDEHGRDVLGFLIASVGPDEAEDCYQEALIAALRSYPRLDHADNLRGWLLTIAHRKAIDHHRSRARGARPAGSSDEVGAASQSPTPALTRPRPTARCGKRSGRFLRSSAVR